MTYAVYDVRYNRVTKLTGDYDRTCEAWTAYLLLTIQPYRPEYDNPQCLNADAAAWLKRELEPKKRKG